MPDLEGSKANLHPHRPQRLVATSRQHNWQHLTVDCFTGSSFLCAKVPALDHHLVIYCQTGTGRFLQERAGKRFQSALPAGSSIIMPAGLASLWHGPIPSSIRLRLSTLFLQQTADEIGRGTSNQAELLNVFLTRDLFVGRFAQIFEAELNMPEHPAQTLVVEAAACALTAHLLRAYDACGTRDRNAQSGLPPKALSLVTCYMQDNLDEAVSLQTLAMLADVSRFHFSRMFKISTGMTPMAYLERSRIERAKALLKAGLHTVSEVAAFCGFSDQSYFCKRFVLHVARTPSQFLRESKRS